MTQKSSNNKNATIGAILLIIGLLLLAKNLFISLPRFLVSWQLIMVAVGVIIGVKTKFKNAASYILIAIGGLSFIHQFIFSIPHYRALFLPIILIIVGIQLLSIRSKNNNVKIDKLNDKGLNALEEPSQITYEFQNNNTTDQASKNDGQASNISELLNVNVYFGSQSMVIYSKNLRRGDVNIIFGSSVVNLREADFREIVVIDILILCGSLELKMPSNWYIKNELTSVFASVEDKRNTYNTTPDLSKVVILRGNSIMSSIDIKN